MKRFAGFILLVCLVSLSTLLHGADGLICRLAPDKEDAIYQLGEKISCKVEITREGRPFTGKIQVRALWEKQVINDELLSYDGKPLVLTYNSKAAGWLVWQIRLPDSADESKPQPPGKLLKSIGVLVSPSQILPKLETPNDFKEFWEAEHDLLKATPLEVKIFPLRPGKPYTKEIALFRFCLNCPGKAPAQGVIALPKVAKAKSCPAIVKFQDLVRADVDAQAACSLAKRYGAVVIAPSWHCLEAGRKVEYYREETGKILGPGFAFIHLNDRKNWFGHDVGYRVLRTVDYVKTRPEWNGKDLAVIGGGFGGLQALVAAGLDQDVTAAVISAPACGEFNARKVFRTPPYLFARSSSWKRLVDPDVAQCLAYHDAVNFAVLVKAECIFQAGLTDMNCPASTVTAIYNALPPFTAKEMVYLPDNHQKAKSTSGNTYKLLDKLWAKK